MSSVTQAATSAVILTAWHSGGRTAGAFLAGAVAVALTGTIYLAALIIYDGWRARGGKFPWERMK